MLRPLARQWLDEGHTRHVPWSGATKPIDCDMPRVLYADHDYPDVELERKVLAAAGIELFSAQCKTEDDVVAAAAGCIAILSQYAPVGERVVAALPRLGLVSRIGAGYDNIDTAACERHGI